MFGLTIKHNIKIINPYTIEKMILLVLWDEGLGSNAEWILHDGSGEEIGRGKSQHSELHSIARQAEINGQAYARRHIQRKYPMMATRLRYECSMPEGEQARLDD